MQADIISIGDELLKGHRVNTNAPFIARELGTIGIAVHRIITCSDDPEAIKTAIVASLGHADLVLVTGGLGPTRDDRTRTTVQELLGRGLTFDAATFDRIADMYRQRGRTPNDTMRDQAMVIDGALTIPNTQGTAPGMILDCGPQFGSRHLVLMPGVPIEMEAMMQQSVTAHFAPLSGTCIRHTPIQTIGTGETTLAGLIADIEDTLPPGTTLSYLPHTAGVTLMVSTTGSDREEVEQTNRQTVDAIVTRAAQYVYATADTTLEEAVGALLLQKDLRVAVAESCTGGLIASRLTDVPGSSGYLLAGLVTYSNEAKSELLGVDANTIRQHGAVSEEVARQMAQGCLERTHADIAIATTGIAGPTGATEGKPVGMLCLALARRSSGGGGEGRITVTAKTKQMHGNRAQNKLRFSEAALHELLLHLRTTT